MRSCIVLFVGRILEAIAMFCFSIMWMCMAVEEASFIWTILGIIIMLIGSSIEQLSKKKFVELDRIKAEEIQDIASEVVKPYTNINTWYIGAIIAMIVFVIAGIMGKHSIIYNSLAFIMAIIGILGAAIAIRDLVESM